MAKRYFVTEKTAGWLREQMAARPGMATAGATRVDGRMGRDENGYPYPFEVCWSEAEGEWLIWLPAGIITSDHGYEGQLLGTLTGSTEYGSGWYVLDVSSGSSWTPVYLDCWGSKYDSSETSPIEYHAELVTSLETHARLVERYVVRVADLKSESSTGAKKVKQITVGALVLKGGGTVGAPAEDLGPFRISGTTYPSMKLTHCYWQQENVTCYMNDVSSASTWAGSFVWLEIDEYNSASVQAGTLAQMQSAEVDDEKSCVPLYKFGSNFAVEIDFRNIPTVQEWMPYSSTSS